MLKRHLLTLACSAPRLLAAPVFAQDFLVRLKTPDPAAIPAWPVTVPNDQILVVKHRRSRACATPAGSSR